MSPNCPVCGAFVAHLRDTHSCPGPSGSVSVVDPRDAQIAALTERLRIVEAERDEAKAALSTEREMREAAESYIRAIPAMCNGDYSSPCALHVRAPIEALRAELERKDAALARAEKIEVLLVRARNQMDGHTPELAHMCEGCKVCADIDAALQPKEPPCQTA